MPTFEITGKGEDTGRKRRRLYSAPNEAEARRLAEDDGTLIEKVTKMPSEPPTERQLDFAKDLGIFIPANATKEDLSNLISRKLDEGRLDYARDHGVSIPQNPTQEELNDIMSLKGDRDKPATERHKSFGRMYGVPFTDYIGKKALFNRIQSTLSAPGREKELLSWFAFRVYRHLAAGSDNAPISRPDDPLLQKIAEQLIIDDKIVKSVRRYEGSDLIWFGEWTSPEGNFYQGGSNRTAAYKQVLSLLKQHAKFPVKQTRRDAALVGKRNRKKSSKSDAEGCLSVLVIAVAIPTVFVLSMVWLSKLLA